MLEVPIGKFSNDLGFTRVAIVKAVISTWSVSGLIKICAAKGIRTLTAGEHNYIESNDLNKISS